MTMIKPEEFRTRRKKLGLSMKAFSQLIGKNSTQIHRWETGKSPVPRYAVICLERYEIDGICPTCFQPMPKETRISVIENQKGYHPDDYDRADGI